MLIYIFSNNFSLNYTIINQFKNFVLKSLTKLVKYCEIRIF
jgi:hypothetical protein